ncbi:MAG: tetratricopeptide repeat protein [Gammaproteobacteria bacterium]
MIKAFIAEVKRRKVFRVVAVYAVLAWLALQIAEVTFEPLGVAPWIMRALIILAVTGFPIAFILAWVIDLTPKGLIFDLPLWHGDGDADESRREATRADSLIVLLLLSGVAAGSYFTVAPLIDMPPETVAATSPSAPPNSIAVMAFEAIGDQEQVGFFANGLAEEVLSMLSTLPEMHVAARSSSFRSRDQDLDARQTASVLGVANILDGSVRRNGDRLRVAAYLTSGASGFQIWSKTYDAELDDVIEIQQQIANAVVTELEIELSTDSSARLRNLPTANSDAYVYYLRGREKLRSGQDIDVLQAAITLFQRALSIDQSYPRAHAGLCESYLTIYQLSLDSSNFQLAETACSEAIAANRGRSSDVYIALATLYRVAGKPDVAREQIDKAIALAPSDPDAVIELGETLASAGNVVDAEAAFVRATTLQPGYWRTHEALGRFYYNEQRYEESRGPLQILVDLKPDSPLSHARLAAAYSMLNEPELARAARDRSLALKPTRQGYTNAGLNYYYAGQFEDAVAMQKKALELAPQDHRVWGRLAESYRFVPGSQNKAREAYSRAAELANESLAINASDWNTSALLAIYYAHLGRGAEAIDLIRRIAPIAGENAEFFYFEALVLLQTGDVNGALDALEASVAAAPSFAKFVVTDPDMAQLADNPRFIALAGTAATQ